MNPNKILSLIVFAVILIFASCSTGTKKQADQKIPDLMERNAALKDHEWVTVQSRYDGLKSAIYKDPNDIKSRLLLAQLFMQEARITGDHPYYYPSALKVLDEILAIDPNRFEALAFKASVKLSQHKFQEALDLGRKAKEINANNGFIYGVLVDAFVELGDYENAVRMSDSMQAIRPGLEAYARVSYLREIYGNNESAMNAMQMAYKAGLPSSEEASWAGYMLGCLYEQCGDSKKARDMFNMVIAQRPNYAWATAGLGRLDRNEKNYDSAISKFNIAISMMPEVSFYEDLAELYELKGDRNKARLIHEDVLKMLSEDMESGHQSELELANTYLKLGNKKKALEYAEIEYKRRPMNIDVNQAMAWISYQSGELENAAKYIDVALRTNKKNSVLLCRAGLIQAALGNKVKAASLISEAKSINSQMPAELQLLLNNNTVAGL